MLAFQAAESVGIKSTLVSSIANQLTATPTVIIQWCLKLS